MKIVEQIRLRLKLNENSEVEYKSAAGGFPKTEFWRTFSAFANTNGGTIVLGVKEKEHNFIPDGLSVEHIAKYKKEFWDCAHNKSCVNIPLLVESDVEEFETEGGQRLLVFHIPRAPYNLRPVHLTLTPFGNTYKRRDEGDYLCSDDEIKQMYSDANNMRASADSRILRGYSFDDIDLSTLHQYRRSYDRRHENHPWTEIEDKEFLENIGAYRKDRATSTEGFTVAGLLMFGKTNSITDPECCQEFFPDYREHLSDDNNIRWTNRIFPDGTWEANLYQFYTRVLPLLQQSLPIPFSLDKNQIRNSTTSAHVALREAFANSLIHAAYTVKGNIVIDKYFDKIVMSNPGNMLISMEEYYEGGHSVCRNPIIQKMFVFLGVGEKGGTGADVIAKGWKDNGWSIPSIVEKSNPNRIETCLIIDNKSKQATETTETTTGITTETTETTTGITTETTETTAGITTETTETTAGITTRTTETILKMIINNPKITTKEIAFVCGITEDGVAYHIKKLKQLGKISRIGSSRFGGEWKVN
ncbi:MAG: RNA-binding domain-containing protein [Muribaculaceae bacterium]